MKWKWVVAAVLVGAAFGSLRAWSEYHLGGERFESYNPLAERVPAASPSAADAPKVVVLNGQSFDFGRMQRGAKRSHKFQFKNLGNSRLELWVGSSTCTCTVASIGGQPGANSGDDSDEPGNDTEKRLFLAPGETTDVLLEWQASSTNPAYTQSAEIRTNDPSRPLVRLSISGQVQELLTIVPEIIRMNNVSIEDGAESVATVYCALEQFPEVLKTEFILEDMAGFFEAELREAPEGPMDDKPGRSAKLLHVRIKPGLPVGTVQQSLRLTVKVAGESTADIPVLAKVQSDVSLLASGDYYAPTNTIRWGLVDRQQGRESTIYVLVKGDYKDQVKLEVEKLDPEGALRVEVLPAKNPSATVLTFPVKVSLRPDTPRMSRLGGVEQPRGEIVLRTGHPTAKQVRFHIQFAVN